MSILGKLLLSRGFRQFRRFDDHPSQFEIVKIPVIVKCADSYFAPLKRVVLGRHVRFIHVVKENFDGAVGHVSFDSQSVPYSPLTPGRALNLIDGNLRSGLIVYNEDLAGVGVRFRAKVHVVEMAQHLGVPRKGTGRDDFRLDSSCSRP